MKKYLVLIVSIILLVLVFINSWYSDYLFDSLFIFAIIPSIILFVVYIICLIVSIKGLVKTFEIVNLFSIIILIIIGFIVLLFPFREMKTNLEFKKYEKDRLKIIQMIKNNKLEADDIGNVKLPSEYKNISTSGEIYIYQNNNDGQVIGFWIFRGMLSGSVQLVYSTGGEKLIRTKETSHQIVGVKKLKDNWYYVETNY